VAVPVSITAIDSQSGVAGVDVRLDNGAFAPAQGSGSSWSATVNIPAVLGNHTIAIQTRDAVGNVGPVVNNVIQPYTVTVTLVDTSAPVLTVATPQALVYDNSPVTCHVTGTAVDSQSGVAWVRVSLIASNGTTIIPDAPATLAGPHGAN